MTIKDWYVDHVREGEGIDEAVYELYIGLLRRIGPILANGEPIYEKEWDVLIILDACRVDLMDEVSDDYTFLSCGKMESLGSHSEEWMEKNFSEKYIDEMSRTAYVAGNPFTREVLDSDDFLILDEVWKYRWDDDIGTIPPDAITDRVVDIYRNEDPEMMIVHYMQPHWPFVPDPLDEGIELETFGEVSWDNVWDRLEKGEVSKERVWDAYKKNLHYVLDSVGVLLENIDAETVVISSDHGNAIGEYRYYGHNKGVPFSCVKEVPWCVTSATDSGGYEPMIERDDRTDNNSNVEDRLEDLGYIE